MDPWKLSLLSPSIASFIPKAVIVLYQVKSIVVSLETMKGQYLALGQVPFLLQQGHMA